MFGFSSFADTAFAATQSNVTPEWGLIDDSQPSSWLTINDSQTGNWTPVNPSSISNWVDIPA